MKNHYVVLILFVLGSMAALAYFLGPRGGGRPGRLVVGRDLLEWRSGEGGTGKVRRSAEATFALKNDGGQDVRIVSVETSCGCAQPNVVPNVVPPGGTGSVAVTATPIPYGERMVAITLDTDSPVTPRLVLHLKIVGTERPPYLLQLNGDLGFPVLTEDVPSGTQEFSVVCLEARARSLVPLIKVDLPFLDISEPTITESKFPDPDFVVRKYTYMVRFVSRVPFGSFSGTLSAIDPWHPGHVEALRVQGRRVSPIRLIPESLSIVAGHDAEDAGHAEFHVLTRASAPELFLEPQGAATRFFILDRKDLGDQRNDRHHKFTVSIRPEATIQPGLYSVLVRRAPGSDEMATLSILVSERGRP